MNSMQILFPSFAMFALSMSCLFFLGFSRYRAIAKGEVKIRFFRTYDEGTQTKRLHLLARHVQNHFEVPPLFHIGVILSFVTATASSLTLICAWLFVAARVLHTMIHLGSNNVSRRFFAFGFSLLMLCGVWLSILVGLLRGAG